MSDKDKTEPNVEIAVGGKVVVIQLTCMTEKAASTLHNDLCAQFNENKRVDVCACMLMDGTRQCEQFHGFDVTEENGPGPGERKH